MGLLVQLAAALLVALLRHAEERADFRRAILAEVERQGAERALAALGWKLAHPVVVPADPAAVFGVRDDARPVRLLPADPAEPADPDRPARGPRL